MLRISKTILVSILLIIGFIGTTSASVVLVTDRTSFAGTDFFDWGQLAGNFSNQVTSDGGLGATLTTPFTSPDLPFGPRAGLFVFTQNVDWFTNFNAGDRLTGSANNASTDAKLTIDFANPISSAGAQISTNWIISYFSAQIDAYNSAGSLLGSVMEEGVSTGAGDNSAIFIGVSSAFADISRIVFTINNSSDQTKSPTKGHDFTINQLDITVAKAAASGPTGVPEPGLLFLIGFSFLGAEIIRKRI